MDLRTLSYRPESRWDGPFPVELDGPRTMVLVFGGSEYLDSPAPIAELAAALPESSIMGCSTAGEINGTEVSDGSLAVAVARFSAGTLLLAKTEISAAEQSFASGAALADRLMRPDLKAVFVLSDGLGVNGSELVRGLGKFLPSAVVVTGGLAGDGPRFKRTWVLDGAVPRTGFITALGIYGPKARVAHGSKGGWEIFGPERLVTRSRGNVLYELDGKPALSLYKEYLGERARDLPASALLFPLSVRENADDPKVRVRTVLAVDESENSMTFAGDIPQGWLAQLMRATFGGLIQGASESATMARIDAAGNSLAVAISCVGRRLVLGERIEEETEAGLKSFPAGTRQIGFYSYGELSPVFQAGFCELQNQTMTYTVFSEND
jgi:hypothetical protein